MVAADTCGCVKRHSPAVLEVDGHHVVPQSWGGSDTSPNTVGTPASPWNKVTLCPTGHSTVHTLLNMAVHLGRMPTRAEVARRGQGMPAESLWRIAALGWENRPSDHPPFTITA